jgi:hypothetical protein
VIPWHEYFISRVERVKIDGETAGRDASPSFSPFYDESDARYLEKHELGSQTMVNWECCDDFQPPYDMVLEHGPDDWLPVENLSEKDRKRANEAFKCCLELSIKEYFAAWKNCGWT